MGRKMAVFALALMLAVGFSAVASAATTEEVLAKLTKQQGEVKTFEADMKSIVKEPGQEGEMVGHMAMEVIVKDGKPAGSKMNMKQKMTKDGADSTMLMVNDGEFLWVEMKDPESGQVMVIKQKGDSTQGKMNNPNDFTDMFDLKLVGEEDFDGQKMWVLEGTPKAKPKTPPTGGMMMEPPQPGKVRMYVGQKDTLCHRYIMYNKAGKEVVDTQLTNIKLNGKLDPALFKYTPPRGARVMDMSKGMPSLDDLKKMMPEE